MSNIENILETFTANIIEIAKSRSNRSELFPKHTPSTQKEMALFDELESLLPILDMDNLSEIKIRIKEQYDDHRTTEDYTTPIYSHEQGEVIFNTLCYFYYSHTDDTDIMRDPFLHTEFKTILFGHLGECLTEKTTDNRMINLHNALHLMSLIRKPFKHHYGETGKTNASLILLNQQLEQFSQAHDFLNKNLLSPIYTNIKNVATHIHNDKIESKKDMPQDIPENDYLMLQIFVRALQKIGDHLNNKKNIPISDQVKIAFIHQLQNGQN